MPSWNGMVLETGPSVTADEFRFPRLNLPCYAIPNDDQISKAPPLRASFDPSTLTPRPCLPSKTAGISTATRSSAHGSWTLSYLTLLYLSVNCTWVFNSTPPTIGALAAVKTHNILAQSSESLSHPCIVAC